MHTKQLQYWDWYSCQVSRVSRRWCYGGSISNLVTSTLLFISHLTSECVNCTTAHSTRLIDYLILMQRYMYKCQGEWTQHLKAIYHLIYSLALLLTSWYAEHFPELHIQSDLHQLFSVWNPCQETSKLSHGLPSSQAQRYPGWLQEPALQTKQGKGQRKGTGTGQAQNRQTALQLEHPAQMCHPAATPLQIYPHRSTAQDRWSILEAVPQNHNYLKLQLVIGTALCQMDLTTLASAEATTLTSCSCVQKKANKLQKQPCKQTQTASTS